MTATGGEGAEVDQQRPGVDEERREPVRPWAPPLDHGIVPDDWDQARYVVVDERYDDALRITVDPWPHVDADGRLAFPDVETVDLVLPMEGWRATIVAAVTGTDGRAPTSLREVRIGDTFAVWHERGEDPLGFVRLVLASMGDAGAVAAATGLVVADVTTAARRMAQAATLAAATRPLDTAQLDDLGIQHPPTASPPRNIR